MRILIDCDVILDNVLDRPPFSEHSTQILRWAEDHPGCAAVAWHTFSNLAYLYSGDIRDYLRSFLSYIEVPPTNTMDLLHSLMLDMTDFEDAMQVAAAEKFGATILVTRNVHDYRHTPIKALSPADALNWLR